MSEPAASRIVITPHPLGTGYTVTTFTGERPSVIPAETLERARTFARDLAATARGGYRIIEETRLSWPLYVPEEFAEQPGETMTHAEIAATARRASALEL